MQPITSKPFCPKANTLVNVSKYSYTNNVVNNVEEFLTSPKYLASRVEPDISQIF